MTGTMSGFGGLFPPPGQGQPGMPQTPPPMPPGMGPQGGPAGMTNMDPGQAALMQARGGTPAPPPAPPPGDKGGGFLQDIAGAFGGSGKGGDMDALATILMPGIPGVKGSDPMSVLKGLF